MQRGRNGSSGNLELLEMNSPSKNKKKNNDK